MTTEREFTALAETYMDMIYRIALNAVRQPADAEDVTQNVLLRLYRSGMQFESSDHARHWLIRVTVNESKRLLTVPWRRQETGLDEVAETVIPAAESGQQEVLRCVLELPVKYRLPLYLYYYEGYSVKEISRLLSRRESTVQTHLARGRERLRAVLEVEV